MVFPENAGSNTGLRAHSIQHQSIALCTQLVGDCPHRQAGTRLR